MIRSTSGPPAGSVPRGRVLASATDGGGQFYGAREHIEPTTPASRTRQHTVSAVPIQVPTPPPAEPEDQRLVDFKPVKRWSGFAVRSVRRHPVIGLLSALVLVPLAALAFMGSPVQYRSVGVMEVRAAPVSDAILTGAVTERNPDDDLANAPAAILRESSIESMVDEAGLVDRVNVGEPFVAGIRRQLKELVRGAPSEAAVRGEIANRLRGSLLVTSNPESNTLRVSAVWNNPDDAQRIAELAQQTFLDDRRRAEIEPINGSLEIIRAYQADNTALIAQLQAELPDPAAELPPGSPLLDAYSEEARLAAQAVTAQQQLDAAELAFDYRYQQIDPPARPSAPEGSGTTSILIVVLAAAFGVVVICLLVDIVRGRIEEGWQVERYGVANLGVLRTAGGRTHAAT